MSSYRAFLSYAHEDEAFTGRLHDRLERFVVPRELRGESVGKTLGPIFRDREELSSGGRLSDKIVRALTDSEFLIVVCSEAAATSRWVGREIESFLGTHSVDRVLLVVADGVPRGDIPVPREAGRLGELLAADARPFGDGFPAAVLKLVSGLLGVPYDMLVQRERARRRKRNAMMAATAVLLAIALGTAFLLVQQAEREATERRLQATAFVGVFIDDLQERIESFEKVGELDERLAQALEFFATFPLEELESEDIRRYRIALVGVGTVRIRQGKPREALGEFQRALELSRFIKDLDEDDARRWAELSIHSFYIGQAYWEMQDVATAAIWMTEALEHSEKAAELEPGNFGYQIEVIYGLNNLGAVNTRLKRYSVATDALDRAVARIERLRPQHPDRAVVLLEQEVEAVSWRTEITQTLSQYDAAFEWHDREIELRKQLIEATGVSHHVGRLSDALGYYAESLRAVGDVDGVVRLLEEAVEAAQRAAATDADNAFFRERLLMARALLAGAMFDAGRDGALAALDEAERGLRRMLEADEQVEAVARDLLYTAATRAYVLLDSNPAEARDIAVEAARQAASGLDRADVNPTLLANFMRCAVVLAAAETALGEPTSNLVNDALGLIERHGSTDSVYDLAYRALLLQALGRRADARAAAATVAERGFRSAFYLAMSEALL